MPLALCDFEPAKYLIISSNVPPLVYYSHISVIVIALLAGIFVLWQGRKSLANIILFFTTLAFAGWVFLDLVFWATNRSDVIMFVWSLTILLEPVVYGGSLYLTRVLIDKRDVTFTEKLIFAALYLPVIVCVPTRYSLSGFNLTACLSDEGPIALFYTYGIELLLASWLLIYAFIRYHQTDDRLKKKEILYVASGITLFLFAFSWGNIISSFTEDWNFAQIGLFAMPIFIAFLTYSIVRFKTFNIRLAGFVALVVGLWVLISSLLLLDNLHLVRIVTSITLVISIFFGILLIRSIRKEIKQREHIEKLMKMRSEFLDITSHQLRTPVSVILGTISLFKEGTAKQLTEVEQQHFIDNIFHKAQKLTNIINDILQASEMDIVDFVLAKERVKSADIGAIVAEVCNDLSDKATLKGIVLQYIPPVAPLYAVTDPNYLEQAFVNLIDNAIKYTIKGSVRAELMDGDDKVIVKISDTGIGIPLADQQRLFEKFNRAKNAVDAYTDGSGLGLFIVKKIVEAHPGGHVYFTSAGENQGTTFFVELPKAKAQ